MKFEFPIMKWFTFIMLFTVFMAWALTMIMSHFGLVPTIIVWALLIAIVAAVFDGMDAL